MKKCVLAVLAALALAAPAGALASGVVLKVAAGAAPHRRRPHADQRAARAHEAAPRLHVGQRVDLHARTLRNGTLAASKVEIHGRARP